MSRLIKQAFPFSQLKKSTTSDHTTIIAGVKYPPVLEDLMRELDHLKAENRDIKLRYSEMHKEMVHMLASTFLLVTGPNVDNFSSFNLDSIMTDIKTKMPVTFSFVTKFGDSHRNMYCEAVVPVEGIKALFSLLVLLNARSNRANGMQTLIGMMLVGRSTHKHVCVYDYIITMQRKWLCNVYLSMHGH